MLVEVFRTAANNGTKLNVNEVMQSVQQIVEDPGKFKIYFFPPFLITCIKWENWTKQRFTALTFYSLLKKFQRKT